MKDVLYRLRGIDGRQVYPEFEESIRRAKANGESSILAVVGPPGSGKTEVSTQLDVSLRRNGFPTEVIRLDQRVREEHPNLRPGFTLFQPQEAPAAWSETTMKISDEVLTTCDDPLFRVILLESPNTFRSNSRGKRFGLGTGVIEEVIAHLPNAQVWDLVGDPRFSQLAQSQVRGQYAAPPLIAGVLSVDDTVAASHWLLGRDPQETRERIQLVRSVVLPPEMEELSPATKIALRVKARKREASLRRQGVPSERGRVVFNPYV